MSEEIFGPVLPVVCVDSLNEAIGIIKAGPKPLGVYAFTKFSDVKKRILAETSSGGVVFNHLAMHCLVPQLPFGGVGNTVIFYGKDGDITGPDREHAEVSMLALHLLQSALVHINILLLQAVLEVPEFHDSIGQDERRALTPLF
jgi:Aldehyde dehydrogenase family/Tn3 transposase DDE domain